MFLKNRKIISEMKRSKVTDYAALIGVSFHSVDITMLQLKEFGYSRPSKTNRTLVLHVGSHYWLLG